MARTPWDDLSLASYSSAEGSRAAVVRADGDLVDVGRAASGLSQLSAFARTTDMLSLFAVDVALDALDDLRTAELTALPPDSVLSAADVRFASPVPRPGKVVGVGLNIPGLVGGPVPPVDELPSHAPFWFAKASTSVVGDGAAIVHPGERHTNKLIPEPELAMVVGRLCGPGIATPKAEEAHDFIAGWTICNDVSALDIEFERGGAPFAYNLDWSKSYPTFSPIGPWLTRLPEGAVNSLDVVMRVNDRTICEYNTADMLWNPYELLEYFAAVMIMEPGDVISCGNAPPVQVIVPGDVVEIEITRLGLLTSPVVASGHPTDYRVPERVVRVADEFLRTREGRQLS